MVRRRLLAVLCLLALGTPGPAAGRTPLHCVTHAAARRARARDATGLPPGTVAATQAELARLLRGRRVPADRITVPVRFHVLSDGRRGRLPLEVARRQIATLNDAYGGVNGGADTGVGFRLDSYEVTDQPLWFEQPQQYEQDFKKALRRGGPGTLNLYTAAVGDDVLGFSTFPQWYGDHPVLDGVVVDFHSLPGGGLAHFDRGFTAVHETGHWLGLYHTFENGCDPPGDAVDDTPYEAEPTDGCPWLKDTCWAPGADPVHNYMDYAYDECMTEFTAGQGRRIHQLWAAYRSVAGH